MRPALQTYAGVLHAIVPAATQTFVRVRPARSAAAALEERFEHFCKQVWPRLRLGARGGDLLLVPSYFDYVRLRNFLKARRLRKDAPIYSLKCFCIPARRSAEHAQRVSQAESAAFVANSEYSDPSDVGRARRRACPGLGPLVQYRTACLWS